MSNFKIISSERKEAILSALEHFIKRGLVQELEYENCTTRNFRVHGENYLKIMHEFDKVNTANEENLKISINELHDLLQPYFVESEEVKDDPYDGSRKVSLILSAFQMDSKVLKLVDEDIYKYKEFDNDRPTFRIPVDVQQKGTQLYYHIITPQYASYYKNDYKIVLPSDGTGKLT